MIGNESNCLSVLSATADLSLTVLFARVLSQWVSTYRMCAWQHPGSIEDYLQEFARAGRDGAPSVAVLLQVGDAKKISACCFTLPNEQTPVTPSIF